MTVELAEAAEQTEVFVKLTPDQKVRVVSVLRRAGHTVGFMGDGINDAAAMNLRISVFLWILR